MNQIKVKYTGDLRTESMHVASGTVIKTDAPKDNQGLGRKFSPTDLVASALGSCLLTIMGIVAKRHNIDMTGSYVNVEKKMDENPRRISQIDNAKPLGIKILNSLLLYLNSFTLTW